MNQLIYILLGIATGALSGMFGIGGGIVLVPAFVFFCGLTQHQAQGTTLTVLILPVGILAAMRYYHSGNVKIQIAAFVCAGFFIGGLVGASLVQGLPEPALRRAFGVLLFLVSIRMMVPK
jgi:uncharacterized membrane protein YfcA